MSTANVTLFFEKASRDYQLQKQLYKLSDSSDEEFINKLVELGRENGYEFSSDDVRAIGKVMAIMAESSDIPADVFQVATGTDEVPTRYYYFR